MEAKKTGKTAVGIQVNPKLWAKFKIYCKTRGLIMGDAVEKMIKELLKEQKQ